MTNIAIEVKNVSKEFKIYFDRNRTLKEKVLFRKRNHHETKKVLSDISFSVKKGETIGLIGENGCGKSTLLKLISRIIYPNTGNINVFGRVSSLLELGAGFHPDMTGRENIYTNASILGLTKREIDARVEKIIEFSELGESIDLPVRVYSSGMYMRLAFSVAINVDAEILLIDEILAVGDANFQKKCMDKIKSMKRDGISIILVSHDMAAVEKICERCIFLQHGKLIQDGPSKEVVTNYLKVMKDKQDLANKKKNEEVIKEVKNGDTWGNKEVEIIEFAMLNEAGEEATVFRTGEKVDFVLKYIIYRPIEELEFGVGIFTQDGKNCYGTNTTIDKYSLEIGEIGIAHKIIFSIEKMNLVEGTYWIDIATHSKDGYPYDYRTHFCEFSMVSEIKDIGVCRLDHRWIVY